MYKEDFDCSGCETNYKVLPQACDESTSGSKLPVQVDKCWVQNNGLCSEKLTEDEFIPCPTQRVYHHVNFTSTARADFDLVCENQSLGDLSVSLFYFGFGIGGILGGIMADKLGRKWPTILFAIALAVSDMISSYSQTPMQLCIMRFVMGFFLNAMMVPGFTLCMEIININNRGNMAMFFNAMFATGCMILSYPYAYLIKDWRGLNFWLSTSCLPVIILTLFVPESYKWLIAKGKPKKAFEIAKSLLPVEQQKNSEILNQLESAIQENVDNVRHEIKTSQISGSKPANKSKNATVLLSHKNMMPVTLNCCFNWFTCSIVYYGLGLNIGNLPGSAVFNNFANSFIELPGYLCFAWLLDFPKLGRTKTMAIGHIAGGLCCLLSTFCLNFAVVQTYFSASKNCETKTLENASDGLGTDQTQAYLDTFGLVLAYIGKFFYAGCFGSIYSYSAEIFPAEVRSAGVGIGSAASRVGGVLIPFILSTSEINVFLPSLIFCFCGVLCGILSLFQPETLGKPLLATMEETEVVYFDKDIIEDKEETSSSISE